MTVYKTANGRKIDFEQFVSSRETVPAVGNLRVNARGDQLDKNGNIIQSRDEVVVQQHRKGNVKEEVVSDSIRDAKAREGSAVPDHIPAHIESFDDVPSFTGQVATESETVDPMRNALARKIAEKLEEEQRNNRVMRGEM